MNANNLRQIMDLVESFPGLPGVSAKLLQMLEDPDVTAEQIEVVIRYDPGLTANILRLANSAYFGFAQKIGSLHQAIVMLGTKQIIQMVMAACMSTMMSDTVVGYDLNPGDLWRHAIAVSVAAEGLLRELGRPATPEIFTAALLHDIGKLILGRFVYQQLQEIDAQAKGDTPFQEAESLVLGIDHAEVGADILRRWHFPDTIVDAVRWHHDPEAAPRPSDMIDLVHVANVLCLMIGIGVGREGLQYAPSAMATARLNLKTRHLEMVASETMRWVDELQEKLTLSE